MSGLPCPKCLHPRTTVIDSRLQDSPKFGTYIRRRRQCDAPTCSHRITTYEITGGVSYAVALVDDTTLTAIRRLEQQAIEMTNELGELRRSVTEE